MEALRFTGTGNEYFKIWIVNVLLTIITLGIYYPWAKVRNRRYFYANSNLLDRNFEYHATGKQLFIGFLIAMAFFIIYSIAGQMHPFLALGLMLLLLIAIPWLIWRSLIFNMRVTSFSNVHFSFVGTLKKAYVNFFVYPILIFGLLLFVILVISVVITKLILASAGDGSELVGNGSEWLALIMPVIMMVLFVIAFYLVALIKKKNTEYLINGSRYGQGLFETVLEAKKFMMINLKAIGISLLVFAVMGVIMAMFGEGVEQVFAFDPENLKQGEMPEGFIGMFVILYFLMIIAMILIMSFTITRQRTYIYENTKLDEKITFESTLRARDFAWVMLSNMFLVLITLGFAMPWVKVRMARLMLENTLVDTSLGFDEYITGKQEEESSLGEQIGDAFDVDVGVAF